LTFIISSNLVYSQGFDWQYSARLPAGSPVFFAGLTGSFNLSNHYGAISLNEYTTECCTFAGGKGKGFDLGITSEYWFSGSTALTGGFSFIGLYSDFSRIDSVPRITDYLVSKYASSSSLYYLGLDIGLKQRLWDTHLWIGGELTAGYNIQSNSDDTETILAPSSFPINDPPWSNGKRTIFNGEIGTITNLLLIPKVKAGYDFSLGLGTYGSIFVAAGFPAQNLSTNGNWRFWNFQVGASVVKGIFYN
jgi:hypothetical protein